MTGDQRTGCRHPDEHGTGPLADRRTRLLSERGVRLVADDDRVDVRDLAGVAHEPLVGLHGHRAAGGRFAAGRGLEKGRCDAVLVAARAQLAEELVDEVAPVGEDQDAAGSRGLGESERGNRLARTGGVLEPEAAVGTRILGDRIRGRLLLGLLGRVPVERLLVGKLVALDLDLARVKLLGRLAAAVAAAQVFLDLRDQRDQRAGQRIDLMRVEQRAVREVGLFLDEQPFQAQQQRVVAPPFHRGLVPARLQLVDRCVQRRPPGRALRQRERRILAGQHKALAHKLLGTCEGVAGNRRISQSRGCLSHLEAFLMGGDERAERRRRKRGPSRCLRGPPVVFAALRVPSSSERADSSQGVRRRPITAHEEESGSAKLW